MGAGATFEIPLTDGFGQGDVILIAPAVESFASSASASASAYFGRQSDPSNATTGWARYATDLGWFPEITIQ